jgi:hypothetical protein
MRLTAKAGLAAVATLLSGCDADGLSTDDPVWHLSVRQGAAAPRYVATFDMEAGLDERGNHSRCREVQARLQAGRYDVQYLCKVGRFRPN